ncbi:EamA family transporter [Streptomyces sp. NPDC051133]|uniref:EamA family transporter n=1 Tax=Streptomyces sp. NPDC051133 TaxID=3155521 RepID=UPI0034265BB9
MCAARPARSSIPIGEFSTPRARAALAVGRGLGAVPAPGLVLGGVLGLQGGAALTTGLYPAVGPAGVVTLRLCIAALVLSALWRPRPRGDRTTLALAAGAGTLLAVHHLAYYEAVARLPLGAATTLEFLGPFAVALCGSRRAPDLVWAGLAATGVVLLGRSGTALDARGAACAIVAGCCWGGYILVGKRLAGHVPDGRGLALAVAWGALLSLPYGIARAGGRLLAPGTLAVAAAVAVLSSVLPYTLQLEALRRLTPRAFGVLTSTEPAIGALTGLFVLGQRLAVSQWAGVVAVALASVGATRAQGEPAGEAADRPGDVGRPDGADGPGDVGRPDGAAPG